MKPFNIALFAISIGYLMIAPFIIGDGNYTFTFIGLGLISFIAVMYFFAKKNAGKQYDKDADQFQMSYEVDDEGLTYIIKDGSLPKKWMDFYSATETAEYLYVYVNKNSGMVMVKRDIPTDAMEFIKNKLRESLPAKRAHLQ